MKAGLHTIEQMKSIFVFIIVFIIDYGYGDGGDHMSIRFNTSLRLYENTKNTLPMRMIDVKIKYVSQQLFHYSKGIL